MTSNWLRACVWSTVFLLTVVFVSQASAFCSSCGGGSVGYAPSTYTAAYAPAYTTAYAPAYTTAYAPVAYTANYGSGSSWFPGCCLGRLFGWSSNYAPTYAVSYAPACTSCVNYAPCTTCSPCNSCSPCSSCTQQVTMRPVCTTSCSPGCGCSDCGSSCGSSCSGCSSCGGATVSQVSYQGSSGCASCGQSVQAAPPATVVVVPGGAVQQTMPNSNGNTRPAPSNGSVAPEIAPGQNVPERTFQKPATDGLEAQPTTPVDPGPGSTTPSDGTDSVKTDSNANYFEAPRLFNPNDRTATRVAAPVRNAIYEKQTSYRQVSTGRITAAQAQQDAAGWTSASH